jgi:hypothetical protein
MTTLYRTVPADCNTTIGRAKSSAFVIPPQVRLGRWKRLATPAVLRVLVPRLAEMPSSPFVYRLVASGARVPNLLESATCGSVGEKGWEGGEEKIDTPTNGFRLCRHNCPHRLLFPAYEVLSSPSPLDG